MLNSDGETENQKAAEETDATVEAVADVGMISRKGNIKEDVIDGGRVQKGREREKEKSLIEMEPKRDARMRVESCQKNRSATIVTTSFLQFEEQSYAI
ncbi:hypothetical protein DITRI_Ditri11bG0014800 [Diplodiscus trichospermus]